VFAYNFWGTRPMLQVVLFNVTNGLIIGAF
jgi:hypothetical protein